MWERGSDGKLRRARGSRLTAQGSEEEAQGAGMPGPGFPAPCASRSALRVLWLAARDVYDHLGIVVLASFLWMLITVTLAAGGYDCGLRIADWGLGNVRSGHSAIRN